jgi:peptidoglycan/LPS O-acetylase OafA/YrhL
MLAVARSRDGQPKGGMRGYFKRRIRRIWPPYYAALLISILVILLVPGMNQKHNVWWDLALPALTPQAILSHVFFVQSLNPDWFFKINPPMWTVAVEEQIYIVFPLLLLPIWRRFGSVWMAAIAIIVGVSSWFIFSPYLANPWFLGLFALGALGASAGFSTREREHRLLKRFPWAKAGLVLFVVFMILNEVSARVDLGVGDPSWFIDLTLGAVVTCLLVSLTELWKSGERPPRFSPLRLFQLSPVVGLGRFSYSLYLMHAPILAILALLVLNAGIRSFPAYAIMLLIGVPLAVAGTYLFHRVFERPFMPTTVATGEAPAVVEAASAR